MVPSFHRFSRCVLRLSLGLAALLAAASIARAEPPSAIEALNPKKNTGLPNPFAPKKNPLEGTGLEGLRRALPPAQDDEEAGAAHRLVVPSHPAGVSAELIRFDPFTGKTRYIDRDGKLRQVTEPADAPQGNKSLYDVQAALFSGTVLQLFRIDCKSGLTWRAQCSGNPQAEPAPGDGIWQVIQDSGSSSSGNNLFGFGEEKSQVADDRYDLRIVPTDQQVAALRVSRKTGRSDLLRAGGTTWKSLTDDPAPPVGNYDVRILMNDKTMPILLRFDEISGSLCVLNGSGKWVTMPEGGEAPPRIDPAAHMLYKLSVQIVGTDLALLRLNPKTGQTWQNGSAKWTAIEETKRLAESSYELLQLRTGKDSLAAVRLNRSTGDGWILGGGKWTPIEERNPNGSEVTGFRLVGAAANGQHSYLRINLTTGRVWSLGRDFAWEPLADAGPLPKGIYDCGGVISGGDKFFRIRLNRDTGQWWSWEPGDDVWSELKSGEGPSPESLIGLPQPRFEQRLVATKEGCRAIRLNTVTGDGWTWEPTRFEPLNQLFNSEYFPEGDYQVEQSIFGGERVGEIVLANLLDLRSGRVWKEKVSSSGDNFPREAEEVRRAP
jgi:hypothetical protein